MRDIQAGRQTTPQRAESPSRAGKGPGVAGVSAAERLQRSAGNLAIHRLLRSGGIQAKLTVSQPGDEHEREADRVADEVMRMPEPAPRPAVQRAPEIIQRACRECEEELHREPVAGETHVSRMCAECEEEHDRALQAKHDTTDPPDVSPEVESYLANGRAGQPLASSTRAYFEPRFGRDFSHVRIHTDSAAADSASALRARAYTVGSNVVFGGSEYAPETPDGQRLLAHELTHVVQQGEAKRSPTRASARDAER
jgi:hypothetical protein